MTGFVHTGFTVILSFLTLSIWHDAYAQLPIKYPTLELFTNTPCPICGSQNPGFFDRLEDYEEQYHLISFYPGKPYSSCIFYQANVSENTARWDFYPQLVGTPTVVINGQEFTSSGSVSTTILDDITGGESWLSVDVEETTGSTRTVDITLQDHVGGSLSTGKLFAVIVEREIMYDAPNGETLHHNVFRKFLSDTEGDNVDLTSGMTTLMYQYDVDAEWQAAETYVIAWLMDPDSKEIYNSGTRFDPETSSTVDITEPTLHIYPNPTTSAVTINLPAQAQGVPVSIYDVEGRPIHKMIASGNAPLQIDCSGWPAGTYHAKIIVGGKVFTGRFAAVR